MATATEMEWRFPLIPGALPDVVTLLRPYMREMVHDIARPVTFARTFYLDTPDFRYLRAKSPRRHVRLRQYACAATEDVMPEPSGPCLLERKQSMGHRRSVLRIPVSHGVVDELMTEPASRDVWRRAMAEESALRALADALTAALRPVAMTWYRRYALTDATGTVRATIDTQVRHGAPSPVVPPLHLPWGDDVLAFKCATAPPPWLAAVLRTLGAPGVTSEYEAAMSALRSAAPPVAVAEQLAALRRS